MSTTTKPKKKAASKPAAKAKAAAPKKGNAAPPAETKATGECPKGGDHEWTEEDGETFCTKCKEPKPAKATKKAKAAAESKEKKLSAIDAAAQVLAASNEPMGCKELVEAMAAKGLWSSPGGKTPHATLYSAILREISVKGKESRFVKTDRGRFTASA